MSSSSQLITVAAVSLFTGCCLGAFLALPSTTSTTGCSTPTSDYTSDEDTAGPTEKSLDEEEADEEDSESDEEGPEINSSSLNSVPGEVRMALCVRMDLGMQKGKVAAQCAHAAVTCYMLMSDPHSDARNPQMLQRWFNGGQAKITLKVADKDEMDLLFAKAMSLNINAYVVHDAGRTQIPSGSATVIGLGPAPKRVLDQVTGDLRLL